MAVYVILARSLRLRVKVLFPKYDGNPSLNGGGVEIVMRNSGSRMMSRGMQALCIFKLVFFFSLRQ